ncbi:methyltransferase family protein [Micromonospora kangleipakensis]|uniref:Methyltransferase family protein n=1 Tax=Micromonospora kangleipakensis TaxID=1077942 RepID=A0A4Q8B9K7_9ACTN|nr:class I SAM-dependent methyltransferase [Micromonospora kangleipakensis]RZU74427.1 methyltransferase family protein [Micromonospora kangleipakensis]
MSSRQAQHLVSACCWDSWFCPWIATGCGTGDLTIALARRGYEVTAIDISRVAIDMARAKAVGEGLTVHFEVQDATDLSLPSAPFDSVFDSGLLHSLSRRGGGKVDEYLALLPGLAGPGATVFVLAVSLGAGQGWGVTEDCCGRASPGRSGSTRRSKRATWPQR